MITAQVGFCDPFQVCQRHAQHRLTEGAFVFRCAPETPVMRDGKEVGIMRSSMDGLGLALLRLDALDGNLSAGEARLAPRKPAWAGF